MSTFRKWYAYRFCKDIVIQRFGISQDSKHFQTTKSSQLSNCPLDDTWHMCSYSTSICMIIVHATICALPRSEDLLQPLCWAQWLQGNWPWKGTCEELARDCSWCSCFSTKRDTFVRCIWNGTTHTWLSQKLAPFGRIVPQTSQRWWLMLTGSWEVWWKLRLQTWNLEQRNVILNILSSYVISLASKRCSWTCAGHGNYFQKTPCQALILDTLLICLGVWCIEFVRE